MKKKSRDVQEMTRATVVKKTKKKRGQSGEPFASFTLVMPAKIKHPRQDIDRETIRKAEKLHKMKIIASGDMWVWETGSRVCTGREYAEVFVKSLRSCQEVDWKTPEGKLQVKELEAFVDSLVAEHGQSDSIVAPDTIVKDRERYGEIMDPYRIVSQASWKRDRRALKGDRYGGAR